MSCDLSVFKILEVPSWFTMNTQLASSDNDPVKAPKSTGSSISCEDNTDMSVLL